MKLDSTQEALIKHLIVSQAAHETAPEKPAISGGQTSLLCCPAPVAHSGCGPSFITQHTMSAGSAWNLLWLHPSSWKTVIGMSAYPTPDPSHLSHLRSTSSIRIVAVVKIGDEVNFLQGNARCNPSTHPAIK